MAAVTLAVAVGILLNVNTYLKQHTAFTGTSMDPYKLCTTYTALLADSQKKSVLEGSAVQTRLKSNTIPDLCATTTKEIKDMIVPVKLISRMVGPLVVGSSALPGHSVDVKDTYNLLKPVTQLDSTNPDLSTIMGGTNAYTTMAALGSVNTVFTQGSGSDFASIADSLLKVEKTVDFCMANPIVATTSDQHLNNLFKTVNKKTWCETHMTSVKDMQAAVNEYMVTVSGGNAIYAQIVNNIPYMSSFAKIFRPIRNLPGFPASIKTVWNGLQGWEDKTKTSPELITLFANPNVMSAVGQLAVPSIANTTYQMIYAADQFTKYCAVYANTPMDWFPKVYEVARKSGAVTIMTNTRNSICNSMGTTYKQNLKSFIDTYYKAELEKAMKDYPDYAEAVKYQESIALMFKLLRPFFNAPGMNQEIKGIIKGLAPIAYYSKDDVMLMVAYDRPTVLKAVADMDKQALQKPFAETFEGLATLPEVCGSSTGVTAVIHGMNLIGTTSFHELCKKDLSGIEAQIQALVAMSSTSTRKRRNTDYTAMLAKVPQLQLTLKITKPFRDLPGFNPTLKALLAKLDFAADIDSKDVAQLTTALSDQAVLAAATQMLTKAMEDASDNTIEGISALVGVCKNPKAFTSLRNIVNQPNWLNTACGALNDKRNFASHTAFTSDMVKLDKMTKKTSSAMSIISKGSLFYSALVALVLVFLM